MKTWLLLLSIYKAPPNAVNWNGPWEFGIFQVVNQRYQSEADCMSAATTMIANMHKGMLAPMRYKCVSFDSSLPKGSPR